MTELKKTRCDRCGKYDEKTVEDSVYIKCECGGQTKIITCFMGKEYTSDEMLEKGIYGTYLRTCAVKGKKIFKMAIEKELAENNARLTALSINMTDDKEEKRAILKKAHEEHGMQFMLMVKKHI